MKKISQRRSGPALDGDGHEIGEHQRAGEELQARYQELETLQGISQIILISPDLKTTLAKILEKTLAVVSLEFGIIRLLDASMETLEPAASRGYRDPSNIESHRKDTRAFTRGAYFHRAISLKTAQVEEHVQECGGLRTFKREGIHAVITIPVRTDTEILGVLHVGSRAPKKFQPAEIHLLEIIGIQIGIAVQKARFSEATRRHLEQMRALYEIGVAVGSTLDLPAVLNLLMEKINIFLPYPSVMIWLRDENSGLLERAACWNLDEREWKGRKLTGIPSLVKAVIEGKAPVVVRDVQNDPRTLDPDFYRRHGLVSYLGIPLIVKDEGLGVLVFLTREEHLFAAEEVEFLSTLAGQAAIAIHNSQLHEQSKRQAAELMQANKVKNEFLGFVSHELRTPVNVIMGYGAILQSKMLGEINAEQDNALEKMNANSKELLNMIEQLLEATKIEAGAVEPEMHEIRLSPFLDELRSNYSVPLNKEIRLDWNYPADLPAIKTDGEKLRHILLNVVGNAIKYTKQGSIAMSARHLPEAGQVEFEFADTGIGIPQEELPHIFEMFSQVKGGRTRSSGGVGLGLYIVKKFTEVLGGKIRVTSEVGKGSTFTIAIPTGSNGEVARDNKILRVDEPSDGRENERPGRERPLPPEDS
jgi:signal transduction histidine kinase